MSKVEIFFLGDLEQLMPPMHKSRYPKSMEYDPRHDIPKVVKLFAVPLYPFLDCNAFNKIP